MTITIKRTEWLNDFYDRSEMDRHRKTRYYASLMDSITSPTRCYDEPWLKIKTKEGIKFAPLSTLKYLWDKNWQHVVRLLNDPSYDFSLATVTYVIRG